MFLKAFLALSAVVGAAIYFMSGSGYARTVDASPDKVRSGLYALDIRNAPGAPATDSSRSGGLTSNFAVTQEGDDMVWTVTNGARVAVRMIAHLQPIDGGTRTKVTARIERGDAPDDQVAPLFRSTGTTMGLFAMVLEDTLDKVVFPVGKWTEECDAIMARFSDRNAANSQQHNPSGLTQAFAGTAKAAMSIAAMDKELKAAGCPEPASQDNWEPALGTMAPTMRDDGPEPPTVREQREPTFGQPMIDPSKGTR
jgi:hypothetical protein